MIEVTKALVFHSNPLIGYTQSDEITLFFNTDTYDKVPEDQREEAKTKPITRTTVAKLDMPTYKDIEDRVLAYFGE